MRTEPTTLAISCSLPQSWQELTDDSLRLVCDLLAAGVPAERMKIYLFLSLAGLRSAGIRQDGAWLIRHEGSLCAVPADAVAGAVMQLDFLDTPPDVPLPLESFGGIPLSVGADLNRLRFEDYLSAEQCFQSYLLSENPKALDRMISRLVESPEGITDGERYAVVLWWTGLKSLYSRRFPYLFAPAGGGDVSSEDIIASTNAQVRALTAGDITKEEVVFNSNTLRALTELNEKAREAEELKRMKH